MGKGINEPPVVVHRASDNRFPIVRRRNAGRPAFPVQGVRGFHHLRTGGDDTLASPTRHTARARSSLPHVSSANPNSVIKKDSAIRKYHVIALDTLAARHNSGPDVKLENSRRANRQDRREEGQSVDVTATRTDARAHVWLPDGFDGLVTTKTKGSKVHLAPQLKGAAVLYPACEDTLRQIWAVSLDAKEEKGPDPGPNRVFVQTKNMGIRLYAGTEDEGSETCVIQ